MPAGDPSEAPLYDHPAVCGTYFFPMPAEPLPTGADAGPVRLALPDGTAVGGYHCRGLAGAPTLLYLHGNGEAIAHQLDLWPAWARAAGANIFFVDYPGYASSDGEPTFTTCRQAARAALEYLLALSPEEAPDLLVAGRSVGSIFALDAAAACTSPRLRGLLLESGVADLQQRLDLRVAYGRVGLDREALAAQVAREFDHKQKLGTLACPVLVLHCRNDSLVPAWHGEALARWAGDRLHRLVLFETGDHNTIHPVNGEAYQAELARFVLCCLEQQ